MTVFGRYGLPAGIDRQGYFASLGDVSFLGIVTQTRIHQIPLIAGGQEIEITLQRKKVPETLLSQNYTGIGLAEPVFRVKQLLSSAAKQKRE